MNFNKEFFLAVQARLKATANIELRVTPATALPMLVMDSLKLDADNETQDQKYTIQGSLGLTYMFEFSDNNSFLAGYDKAHSIITALHKEQTALKTLQPTLELTRIDWDSVNQELLTEESGNKFYSAIDINFSFQIF